MFKNPITAWLLLLIASGVFAAKTHPFLIVDENQYPQLRAKAAQQPFSDIKTIAQKAWNRQFNDGHWSAMANMMWYNSLLYILDENETNKAKYREKILTTIDRWDAAYDRLGTSHANTVYPAGAFFNCIIAMDIIYNDLSAEQIQQAEKQLDRIHAWYLDGKLANGRSIGWQLARLGPVAVYYQYKQDPDNAKKWSDEYKKYLTVKYMRKDGSWAQSPGYAHARMAGGRLAKSSPVDVLQHVGYYDFYSDRQMIEFMDWMNSFSLTPAGAYPRFGETGLTEAREGGSLFFIMSQYSDRAGANAAWHLRNRKGPNLKMPNNLFHYILMPTERPKAVMPTSLLAENSGAALWGRTGDSEALQGILYCLKSDEGGPDYYGHSCEDVCSIGIHGYGEYLITNSGTEYKPGYPGKAPDGGRWFEARRQNVVLIGKDTTRHKIKGHGGGLVDGLTGGSVEFGVTDSGQSLGNGNHKRALFFIHEQKDQFNGYFAIMDEVRPDDPKEPIRVLILPNSTYGTTQTVTPRQEYAAAINGYTTKTHDGTEKINIFYATPPITVRQGMTHKASFGNCIKGDRLEGIYRAGSNGTARALTILFPEDGTHQKAAMKRIKGKGFTGAAIEHDQGLVDWIIESNGKDQCIFEDITFQARTLFYRKTNKMQTYAVYHGTSFMDTTHTTGFASNVPISIQFDGYTGHINCPQAEITFYDSNIENVSIDEKNVPVLKKTDKTIQVSIPPGRHTITLSQ